MMTHRPRESMRLDRFKLYVGRRSASSRQCLHDEYGRHSRSQAANAGARAKRSEPQRGSFLCARDRAHIVRRRRRGARMGTDRFSRTSLPRSSRGYGHRRGSSRRLVGTKGASWLSCPGVKPFGLIASTRKMVTGPKGKRPRTLGRDGYSWICPESRKNGIVPSDQSGQI